MAETYEQRLAKNRKRGKRIAEIMAIVQLLAILISMVAGLILQSRGMSARHHANQAIIDDRKNWQIHWDSKLRSWVPN